MLRTDKSAVICDLAETYGIIDYKALPIETLAVLCAGLRPNSRIKMKMAGMDVDPDTLMMAAAVDRLSLLVWSKTKDAEKGRNQPKSIVEAMQSGKEDKKVKGFDTDEEFKAARNKIIERINNGNRIS